MHRARFKAGAAGVTALLSLFAAAHAPAADCRVGAFRLADGSLIDISSGDDNTLRWRRFDGTTGVLHETPGGVWTSTLGWTDRADGKSATLGACAAAEIRFDGLAG